LQPSDIIKTKLREEEQKEAGRN